MFDDGKDFANPTRTRFAFTAQRPARACFQLGRGVLVALTCCAVLASVWHAAGDENRRQAIAAVGALERARDSGERIEAIRDLVRSAAIDGPIVIPALVRSVADGAVEVRIEAVRSLGPAASAAALTASGDDQVAAAIAALIRSLDDREPAVRIAAVHALGSIAASKNPSGVINPQTLVGAMAAMLDDPDATVRASTIASLGVAGPVAGADPPPALIAALDDESSFNRAAAVRTLARFPHGIDRLTPALLDVMAKEQDGSPVREACLEVLHQLHAERLEPGKRDPRL
jgi:HEAT repeat protein